MAKITKKNINKENPIKGSFKSKTEKKDLKLKNLVVNLIRLSKQDIENITGEVQKSSTMHTIPIKISDDSLNINGVPIKNNGASNLVFNVGIAIKIDKVITKACESISNQEFQKFRSSAKTHNQLINDEWRRCKGIHKENGKMLEIDMIVMARMRGYAAWPSRINTINANWKRANVIFFGEQNSGGICTSEIVPMKNCDEIIRLLLLRRVPLLIKGIREAEICLDIPEERSLTRELAEISK